jgi:dTMP kinase
VRGANQLAVQGLVPDLTLVFDLSSDEGMARADARGARDRMEQAGDDFHRRVGAAFHTFLDPAWQRAHPECGPVVRIDAAGTEDEVLSRVVGALAAARPETFGVLMGSNV